MGRQICQLPDYHDNVLPIRMTDEEFQIYRYSKFMMFNVTANIV